MQQEHSPIHTTLTFFQYFHQKVQISSALFLPADILVTIARGLASSRRCAPGKSTRSWRTWGAGRTAAPGAARREAAGAGCLPQLPKRRTYWGPTAAPGATRGVARASITRLRAPPTPSWRGLPPSCTTTPPETTPTPLHIIIP